MKVVRKYLRNNIRKLKYIKILLPVILLAAWNFGAQVINIKSEKENSAITFYFEVEKGYGVQKDGPHTIEVYKLAPGHVNEENVAEKIKKYGTVIQKTEKLKGHIAAEDPDYFDKVDPVKIKDKQIKSGEYAYKALIYYCSFAEKFCSAQKIEKLIE